MPNQFDSKLKMLYILDILKENTDAEHRIFAPEIIEKLKARGITAERKSIYRDIDTLKTFGFDILNDKTGFALVSREFELAELKLLIDAVQASRFITGKKRSELTSKLITMTSRHHAKELNRSVKTETSDKETNNSILNNIDWIHSAIIDNKTIRFQYFDWSPEKKQVLRHDGKIYELSPWALVWRDENYYLFAYDHLREKIRHFRVDKMKNITKTEENRKGLEMYSRFDFSKYSGKLFGMFSGNECTVTIKCEDSLAGAVIDRFSTDISIFPSHNGTFNFSVPVILSNNFYSWVLQFGKRMEIIAPTSVREEMKKLLEDVGGLYK